MAILLLGVLQTSFVGRSQSEEKYRTLFDSAGDAIFIYDGDARILAVNSPACERLGYSHRELASMTVTQVVNQVDIPEGGQQSSKQMALTMEGGGLIYETAIRRKDGSLIPTEMNARRITWHGRPAGMGVCRDITVRRQAEQALRTSEENLREAQHLAEVGSWQWDVATDTVTWSDELYRINGCNPELPPPSFGDMSSLYTPESWTRLYEAVTRTLQTGEPYELELDIVRPNGTIVSTSTRGEAHCDSDARIVSLYGTVQNITARKRAEHELLILRMAVDASGEAIFMTDRDGLFIFVNPEFTRLYGYTFAEVVGRSTPRILKSGAMKPEDYTAYWQALLNGGTLKGELINRTKDGRLLTIEGSANVVVDERGEIAGFLAIQRDVTPRKQAEEEKARLEVQLRQAQKMEAVGRLAGGVAHDFNNMLGVILGHAELALEQVDPARPLHEDLIEIRHAAERSAGLTRQLLAFARRQTVIPQVLDLNETLRDMLKMLKRLLGEGIELSFRPGVDLWLSKVDPSQIDQVLANLCVNARDAVGGVGRIIIETQNSTLDEDYCTDRPGCVPGDYVCLTVTDDGRGMDEETLSHLFEPFFTTKSVGEGTGLGLATVYGIVKQNHGYIDVKSAPDRGTTFTVYLPRYEGSVARMEPEIPEPSPAREQETILLVEDESAILRITTRMLAREGYTVLAAGTPGEAMRIAEEHHGEIHLLMTDVVMPEMNGRDLARNLLSLYPRLRRLFMSGYTADIIAHDGMLGDGAYFLQKPFSMQGLATKVREALDGE